MAPSEKPGWIDWRFCKSKKIILEDLMEGVVPLTDEECTAKEAWESWYRHMAEFVEEQVVFEQFELRFKDHREQVSAKKIRSQREYEAFLNH